MTHPSRPDLADEIRAFYAGGVEEEDGRLRSGRGRLELARVQQVVREHLPGRHVPGAPRPDRTLRVLDVGGATGVHAEWLVADGHHVHLVDPVAEQVAVARERLAPSGRFTASVGDVRALPLPDGSVDAVLLFGPLYHLQDAADRVTAWREAARVVVPGGPVLGMAISRFASLFDALGRGTLADPHIAEMVATDLATGCHRNPTRRPGWFTTAYFQRPDELAGEVRRAGLALDAVVGVEGMGGWLGHVDTDPPDVLVEAARLVESEPSLAGLSPHVIAVAHRPA